MDIKTSQLKIPNEQRAEIDALSSMYGDDFHCVNPYRWDSKGVHYWIGFKPLEEEQHVAVRMDVKLPRGYPKSAEPTITFSDHEGFEGTLTSADFEKLSKTTNEKIRECRRDGTLSDAIYEVVNDVQGYLHERNTVQVSTHEEMTQRQRQEEEAERILLEEKDKDKEREENKRKEELLQQIRKENLAIHARIGAVESDSRTNEFSMIDDHETGIGVGKNRRKESRLPGAKQDDLNEEEERKKCRGAKPSRLNEFDEDDSISDGTDMNNNDAAEDAKRIREEEEEIFKLIPGNQFYRLPGTLLPFSDNSRSNGRAQEKQALPQRNESVGDTESSIEFEAERETPATQISRYRQEYQEIKQLGKGGFGRVVLAKYKLDNQSYAIKIIKVRSKEYADAKLEITTLASLNHHSIVRYYHSWVESVNPYESKQGKGGGDGGSSINDGSSTTFGTQGRNDANIWKTQALPLVAELSDEHDPEDLEDDWMSMTPRRTSKEHVVHTGSGEGSRVREGERRVEWLFIQMEYCPNKTLKDVVSQGGCPAQTAWRFFRQLLEAIDHIHKKGIIHRDLKPANIFIDSKENIKLGDFGLAFGGEAGGGGEDEDGEGPSEVVGTFLYRSPEQAAEGKTYNQKADMYALGIILYELFKRFDSEMERARALETLRKMGKLSEEDKMIGMNDGGRSGEEEETFSSLDEALVSDGKSATARVIEALLNVDPKLRPSAQTLLKSPLIPVEVEEKMLDKALVKAASRGDPFNHRVLESLFTVDPSAAVDFTYDLPTNPQQEPEGRNRGLLRRGHSQPEILADFQRQKVVKEVVFQLVEGIFRSHGACRHSAALLRPKKKGNSEFDRGAHVMLDAMGRQVLLPFSLTVPFARFLAHTYAKEVANGNAELRLRRYESGRVFRKTPHAAPRELLQCCYDSAWVKHEDGRVFEAIESAEVLCTAEEILSEFQTYLGKKIIYISHSELLPAIAWAVGTQRGKMEISHRDFQSLVKALVAFCSKERIGPKGFRTPWAQSKLKHYLETRRHVSEESLNLLQRCLACFGPISDIDSLLTRLSKLVNPSARLAKKSSKRKKRRRKKRSTKEDNEVKRDRVGPQDPNHRGDATTNNELNRENKGKPRYTDKERAKSKTVNEKASDGGSSGNSLQWHTKNREQLQKIFDEIKYIVSWIRRMKHGTEVVFDPGLCLGSSVFSSGFIFQACSYQDDSSSSISDIIAIGGRYDTLVSSFEFPVRSGEESMRPNFAAVGLTLAVEKLFQAVTRSMTISPPLGGRSSSGSTAGVLSFQGNGSGSGRVIPGIIECSALVFSPQGPHREIESRLRLASKLWSVGIRADYRFPYRLGSGDPHQVKQYCRDANIRWMLELRGHLKTVRVRDVNVMDRGAYFDVPIEKLVAYLLTHSGVASLPSGKHVWDLKGGMGKGAGLEALATMPYAGGGGKEGKRNQSLNPEITVIRRHMTKKANSAFEGVCKSLSALGVTGNPSVVAVHLPLADIRELCTKVLDGQNEAYICPKSSLKNIPPREKEKRLLVQQLVQQLCKMRSRKRPAFVFSITDSKMDILQF